MCLLRNVGHGLLRGHERPAQGVVTGDHAREGGAGRQREVRCVSLLLSCRAVQGALCALLLVSQEEVRLPRSLLPRRRSFFKHSSSASPSLTSSESKPGSVIALLATRRMCLYSPGGGELGGA